MNSYRLRFFLLVISLMGLIGCSALRPDAEPEEPGQAKEAPPEIDSEALAHFMDGQLYLNQGEYAMAVLEFQDALAQDSLEAVFHTSLGEAYWHLGKAEHAERHLLAAIKLDPEDSEAAEILGRQYIVRKLYPEAQAIYSRLWQEQQKLDFGFALANIAKVQGNLEQANQVYDRIIELFPANRAALENSAQLAIARQDYLTAQEIFEQLVALDQTNPNYLQTLSDICIFNDRIELGIDYLQQLIALNDDIELRLRLGQIYYENMQPQLALDVFNQLYSENERAPLVLYFLATINAEEGDLDVGEKYAREAIADYPDEPRGYGNLALIELERKEVTAAVEVLNTALMAVPDNFTIFYLLGNSHQQLDEFETARDYLKKALQLSPESFHARQSLALIYDTLKDWVSSDSLYELLVKEYPEDWQTLNNYAYSLADRGVQLEKALEMSHKAIQSEPENSAYLDTYGWIFFKMGKYQKAQRYIRKSVDLDPGNMVVLEHLGDVLTRRNKLDEAQAVYRKALEIEPDNESLQAKINR